MGRGREGKGAKSECVSGWSGEEANKRKVEWERGRENEEMGKREK